MNAFPEYDGGGFGGNPELQRRSHIRSMVTIGVGSVFGLYLMQFLLTTLLSIPAVQTFLYSLITSQERNVLLQSLLYILTMGTPILVGRLLMPRTVSIVPRKKISPSLLLLLCIAGIGVTALANIGNNYVLQFLTYFGLFPASSGGDAIRTLPVFLLSLLQIAVLPALLEELLFRGLVLSAMRPAGDGVAVFGSALIFALMHNSLSQLPFTFVLGLLLGYITVRTQSILPAMLIHFLNNGLSVTAEYLSGGSAVVTHVMVLVELLAGALALGALWLRHRPLFSRFGNTPSDPLSLDQRRRAVLLSPATIAFVVTSLVLMANSIQYLPVGSAEYNAYFGITEQQTQVPSQNGNTQDVHITFSEDV